MRQRPNANPILEFILGMILVLAIQIIVVVLSFALISGLIMVINLLRIQSPSTLPVLIISAPMFFIGVTQIAYLVPLCAYFANRRRYEVSKGIIVAAIVTLLINGSCFSGQNVFGLIDYLGINTYKSLGLAIAIALLISGTIGWLGAQWVKRSR
jgi:hypothetical protein